MASGMDDVYMDTQFNLYYPKGANQLMGVPVDELAEVLPEHWGKFPPQNPIISHVFGLMFFFLWIINFVGNGLVIYIFMTTKTLRTPTNMFVINLALSDFIMMTTMGPSVTFNAFQQRYWMYGALACKLYGFIGATCGTCSLLTMVVIGYDRYNVIVKGFSGVKITAGKAFILLVAIWTYCLVISSGPFWGWGAYALDGLLMTCGYDFLSQEASKQSYLLFAFCFNYLIPVSLVCYFYTSIVKAVVMHEAALKAQAKKMNVDSLRSNADDGKESAEVRIAKVAITNVLLWLTIWTPYGVINLIPTLGNPAFVSPLVSQIPAFFAKAASCINPVVYAISHPKYREALAKEVPCFGIREEAPVKPVGKEEEASQQTKA